jgi:hypothetical protein
MNYKEESRRDMKVIPHPSPLELINRYVQY